MTHPDEAWIRLGQFLAAERGGRSRASVAAASGVGARTIQEYESGRAFRRPPQKLWDLLRYYRWTPDSLTAVLAGGLPDHMPAVPPIPALGPILYAEMVDVIANHPTLPRRRKTKLLRDFAERERSFIDAV